MLIGATALPVNVKREKIIDSQNIEHGSGLEVTWSTGEVILYRSDFLRKFCPCADCAALRQQKQSTKTKNRLAIVSATKENAIDLQEVWVIGNYALGIRWGDNHNAGIYTFDLLKKLADIVHLK